MTYDCASATVLKKCPFCGGEAILHTHKFNMNKTFTLKTFTVDCSNKNCIASCMVGADFDTTEEAIEAWNRRVDDA